VQGSCLQPSSTVHYDQRSFSAPRYPLQRSEPRRLHVIRYKSHSNPQIWLEMYQTDWNSSKKRDTKVFTKGNYTY
jgi:hypothetical protein